MQGVGRIAPHRLQIESFENVQHLQRGDALAIGRQFKNVVTAVIRRDRVDPRAAVLFKIHFAQIPAVRVHEGIDLVRDLTSVESVATLLADQAQCVRQRWILEDVAFRRRAAFAVKRVGFEKSAGKSFVDARTETPVIRDQLGDGKTFSA